MNTRLTRLKRSKGLSGLRRIYRHLARSPFDIAGFDLAGTGALRKGCWDDDVETFTEALVRTNVNAAALCGVAPSHRVLDAGCGLGSTSTYLAEEFGCQAVGINLNDEECTGARLRAEQRGLDALTQFEIMDFTDTTFESESFDVIIAIESLTWLDDKKDFLAEASRLLRPGGCVLVADQYLESKEHNWLQKRIIDRWFKGYGGFKLTTIDRFVSAIGDVGLDVEERLNWTSKVSPTTRIIVRHSLIWSVNDFLLGVVLRMGVFRRRFAFWSSAQAEFLAFRFGLASYHVIVARKPSTSPPG